VRNDLARKTITTVVGGQWGIHAVIASSPGQIDNASHPVVDGEDLVYDCKLIEGMIPKARGATGLFIDSIGVGGG
jgi:hypothetical protein